MKRKLLLVLLAVSLAFNLAVLVTFGHHFIMEKCFNCGPRAEKPFFKNKLKKMLGLTEQQVEFMEKDRAEMKKLIDPMREDLRLKREDLFAMLDSDAVDNARMDRLVGEISLLQARIEKAVLNHSIGMRKNLTPEQHKKFQELLRKSFKKGYRGDRLPKGAGRFSGSAPLPPPGGGFEMPPACPPEASK